MTQNTALFEVFLLTVLSGSIFARVDATQALCDDSGSGCEGDYFLCDTLKNITQELFLTCNCPISLPQKTSENCQQTRDKELRTKQAVFSLKPIGKSLNSAFDNPALVLDMETEQFIRFTLQDPFTRYHLQLYKQAKNFSETLFNLWFKNNQRKPVQSFDDYRKINAFFVNQIEALGGKPFRLPSHHEPFQDVISKWQDDKVFTEQRLAGPNPMTLQRVCFDKPGNKSSSCKNVGLRWSSLTKYLNPSFNFKYAVEQVIDKRMTFEQAANQGRLFVLRYLLGDEISDVEFDFMEPDPNRKVRPFNSPIVLFVSKPGDGKSKQAELLPVAIQEDYKPNSPVNIPGEDTSWTQAKLNVQVTDMTYSQIVDHLVKVHLLLEPLCVVLQRRLSSRHPLHQLLKFHCRGATVTNHLGVPNLVGKNRSTDQLNAFGAKGSNELLIKAYKKFGWEQTNFIRNLRRRGVLSRKTLPYFPYRDDGLLIYRTIQCMVWEYVTTYYKSNDDVARDTELQAFLNEVSAEGSGASGGLGKVKRFPSKITSRWLLVDTVTRWISQGSLQHAAVSYPLINYATFTPLSPSKLYSDSTVNEVFGYHNFSNGQISAIQSAVGLVLSVLRYDSLFDYSSELDPLARKIVYKYHCKLTRAIQPFIEWRNKLRFKKGHLTYPYLIPRWLPNGVQT